MTTILNKLVYIFNTEHVSIPTITPLRSKPAEIGEIIANFYLKADQGYWEGKPTFISHDNLITEKQLFRKPLVLAFYSAEWKRHGLQQLKTLQALQKDINILGGQLLVISDADLRSLRQLIVDHNLSLNIYADPQNILAENLGIFNAADPIYNRISGIDNNAPLLATYVVTPTRKIAFRFIDTQDDSFPAEKLLASIVISATNS
ncbi:peroxiredoxin family protein [Pedobacter sp. MC2016-14]|uniref:redoxin domain-containing protein n=1 Tax=Pedobacter sp. MC2016-14 TaxID=2897327 RepID=UPI001E39594E|nr:redoxin domain-containing protein [Pedobacter sp. MC2016-14]MCD0490553.1 peroxiredoxin family protein [Pedobacter sp. MC2016-14]